jgi:hypothetical protein
MLVGVGGSGRKSLARLAAYVAELKVFSIEITKTYRLTEFREDLKGLYRQAGVANKPTVFLFDETQVRGRLCCCGGLWLKQEAPASTSSATLLCYLLSSSHAWQPQRV